jgi:hypothetical protein
LRRNKGDEVKKTLLILAAVFLSGCTSETEFGACIGAFDDKRPELIYKVSANNLVWGILGFSLVAPPIFVIVDQFHCPVGKKEGVTL